MATTYSLTDHVESWVEVSSRPSSSSLSSIATDEVITTGLTVSQDARQHRRRRLFRSATTHMEGRRPLRVASLHGSTQEDYEESEGDSDRILSSSTEELQPRFLSDDGHDESPIIMPKSKGSDRHALQEGGDYTATASGPLNGSPVFTPQPNAFSHPPSGRLIETDTDSYFPPIPSSHTSSSRPNPSTASAPAAFGQTTRSRSHTPYNIIAPSVSVDHDAALRASLSTLLSCAAAARGLPKRGNTSGSSRSIVPPRSRGVSQVQPNVLRIVPESALTQIDEHSKGSRSSSNSPSSSPSLPSKRKSKSPVRDRRKRNRSAYNLQSEDIMSVSPTLTTWVVGAGVLVLFSAISFTAGYALGKEVGRFDPISNISEGNALNCAREVNTGGISRGLARRSGWRWGNRSGISA